MTNRQEQGVLKLLAIDDEAHNLELVEEALARDDVKILTCTDPEVGLEIFFREQPVIVLLDLMMPKMNGMQVLEAIVASNPMTEVILITANYSPEAAVEAIRKGASDCLPKPVNVRTLRERVNKLLDEARRRRRALKFEAEVLETFQFEGIVGRSPRMLDVFAVIRRVAPHFRTL